MAMRYPLQSALPTCKHHLNEELNYYCQTCNLRVCEECCHGRHSSHKWMSNKKFARLVRQNTGARCEELEDMIRGLEIGNEDVEMEADIDRIEDVRRKWVQAINDRADMLKAKRRAGRSRKISTEEITKLKKMLKFLKQDLTEADDNVAVEMEEEFHKKKQNVSPPTKTTEKKLIFKEGTVSTDVINNMFGDVVEDIKESKVNVIEKSHFTHIVVSDYIYCIVPLKNDEALITRYSDDHIDHVDITGNTIKKLPSIYGYFTMLDNDIVYTYFGGKMIRRVTPSGTESDICSTAPLHPNGICKSYSGGLLVTLCSCYVSEITSDSYGEVHHINTSDGIIKKYTNTQDRKSKLFIFPLRVVQNKNTDLCVVEHKDTEYRSRLVCVSMLSEVRYTYTGQPALTKRFSCSDVACDHHGRILLVDILNHAVHLLREDGHFLQYVLTEQSPLKWPHSLGLYGDTLWVGCEKGVVRVYKYSDEKC